MNNYNLGKRKVLVDYVSEEQHWQSGDKSGIYYNVDIKCPEESERTIQTTSNYLLKKGEQIVNLVLEPKIKGNRAVLVYKIKKEAQEK